MNEALRALTPGFHTTLPIGPLLGTIADTILRHPVTIVSGATGSGKSTQVPQLCLRCAPDARIGHTQPRRLAARTVAARIAHECGEKLGERIGCQTRFDHRVSASTRLKVMTDGILLQEITREQRHTVAMPIAGDDANAISVASRLVRDAGLEPVVVGPLAMGRYLRPGTPLAGVQTPEQILKIIPTLN